MLTRVKSPGSTDRLGKRAKSVLLLMLEYDNPPGTVISLYECIHERYQLFFGPMPKRWRPDRLHEEKKFRYAVHRLLRLGFIHVAEAGNYPLDRRKGYIWFVLTKAGRETAEKLRWREKAAESRVDFEEAVRQLKQQGIGQVTLKRLREVLWRFAHDKFAGRREFDRYWNSRRMGLALKKHVSKQSCVSLKNRKTRYFLTNDTHVVLPERVTDGV